MEEHDLRETCLGHWQGSTWDIVNAEHSEEVARWRVDTSYRVPGGGESMQDRFHRVTVALHAIALSHVGETTLVVAHGGTLEDIGRLVLRVPFGASTGLRKVNTCLCVLEFAPRWEVARGLLAAAEVLGGASAAAAVAAPVPEPSAGVAATSSSPSSPPAATSSSAPPAATAPSPPSSSLSSFTAALRVPLMSSLRRVFVEGAMDPRTDGDRLGEWSLLAWGITEHLDVHPHLAVAHGAGVAHKAWPPVVGGAAVAGGGGGTSGGDAGAAGGAGVGAGAATVAPAEDSDDEAEVVSGGGRVVA